MTARILLLILGLYHFANALWMLVSPGDWYAVPAVTATGPQNDHFIIDIALAFLASGVGLMIGGRRGAVAAAFALAGAVWPALHGLYHVVEWIGHGVPADLGAFLLELIGVIGIGGLGLGLALWHASRAGALRGEQRVHAY